MKLSSIFIPISLCVVLSGCMTPVTVQTNPPGATVYCRGSGRAAYKWKPRGMTAEGKPVVFKVPYNTIQTFAIWPAENGKPAKRSEVVKTKLLFREDPVILLTK